MSYVGYFETDIEDDAVVVYVGNDGTTTSLLILDGECTTFWINGFPDVCFDLEVA